MLFKGGTHRGLSLLVTTLAAAAILLSGCNGGSDGAPGAPGATGATGATGPAGTNATAVVNVSSLAPAQWAALQPKITINSVTIANGPPVVKFTVTDQNGNAILGLEQITSKSSTANYVGHPNFAFNVVKLMPPSNGSPSRWVNYMVISPDTTTNPAKTPASHPTTDPSSIGTLIATGNGGYQYTFWTDITQVNTLVQTLKPTATPYSWAQLGAGTCPGADLCYDASKSHRFTMSLSGAAPGTGTNTPTAVQTTPAVNMVVSANAVYDFIPATGAMASASDPSQSREIVAYQNCYQCHQNFSQIHSGSRVDTKLCVTCHTGQLNWEGVTEATYTGTTFTPGIATNQLYGFSMYVFPNWIHKIHMGSELTMQGYNSVSVPGVAGITSLNGITYPQDQRNCVKCHSAQTGGTATPTAQGDNWKNVPNRMACGACHDGVNFATGGGMNISGTYPGHIGGAQADDNKCTLCHSATDIASTYHVPVAPPSPNNPITGNGSDTHTNVGYVTSNQANLPAGASTISYVLGSVTKNSAQNPVVQFRIMVAGKPAVLNAYTAGSTTMIPNFAGTPAFVVAYGVPQENATTPVDFNLNSSVTLMNVWNGSAGTLSGPDASGNYTATLTKIAIPANAAMVTVGFGYNYGTTIASFPLTQTNLPAPYAYNSTTGAGGLIVAAPDVWAVMSGYTSRRVVVDNKRCSSCHYQLGVFTSEAFHAGQRNDGQSCNLCHYPNGQDSGWTYDSKTHIHAIHAANKRTVPFTWHANSATSGYWQVTYPGNLDNCEQCHLPNTYNFGSAYTQATSTSAPTVAAYNSTTASNMLYSTVAAGTLTAGSASLSPYVSTGPGTCYGAAPSVAAATGALTGATTAVASATCTGTLSQTLVSSPIASACFACHDSAVDMSHMRSNGGSLYAPRSTALATQEQCLVCHSAGMVADTKAVHFTGVY